ncbi:ABC transporter permease [Desertihabitans aurantiacus]|uniref:ABC transporter permease n=1 Tax=Desertihabitans aurantiacus TaxID=2282477 RepID=UPI000DF7EE00|nr:ABC transporter permease [Desertihabitans aurantiacus]
MTTVAVREPLATTPPVRPGVLTPFTVFVGRSLRHSLRDPEALLMGIALPTLLMLVFTFVFGGAIGGDSRAYIDYVTPGIILLCAGYGAATTAVAVSRDMTTGTIDRVRTMPVPGVALLVGHTVASLLRNLFSTAVVILVGVLLGFRPAAGPVEWLAAVGLVALWILAITALFAFLGLVAGSAEAASGYGFILLFLPYASSAFVPVATMPSWLRVFAEHQPITPLTESIRALLAGVSPGGDAVAAVLWPLGVLAVALVLTAWRFPRTRSRLVH